MIKYNLISSTFLSGVLAVGLFGTMAMAADVGPGQLPAVSAFNGKVEFGGGFSDYSGASSDELIYGAASLSMPLGDMFGLQADLAVKDVFGETGVGGTVHLFTRDPGSHLLGVIAGYGDVGNVDAYWAGGEAEFYLDQVSIELAGGYMNVDPAVGSNQDELFAFADVAFYPMDNMRLSLGAASVAGFESAHVSAEYMLDAMPVALKLTGELGEDSYSAVTAGVSFYFGGNESSKSLIRRHREDDPRNRALDIFGSGAAAFAAAGVAGAGGAGGDPCDVEFPDPEFCMVMFARPLLIDDIPGPG
jgi:hypothetical protein